MAKAKCDECLKDSSFLKNPASNSFSDADFLCNDCEKYLCSNCIAVHAYHSSFALKDKSNKIKFNKFCTEMMNQLESEGDQTLEKFTHERTHVCDVVDVEGRYDVGASWMDICILRDSKKWAVTDYCNNCIKVFNINNNQMTKIIHLAYKPYGITEIPSTHPSQSLIAVSLPGKKQIEIININSEPTQVISNINVHGECYDLAYCNDYLITTCQDYQYGHLHHSIHLMDDISGEIINTIDLHRLPLVHKLGWCSIIRMHVHSESYTIYVCANYPSYMIGLSLDGLVLHPTQFTDMNARCICVDRDQTLYVIGDNLALYKLSSDLSQKETVIDKEILYEWSPFGSQFRAMACHADTFYIVRSDGIVVIIRHE